MNVSSSSAAAAAATAGHDASTPSMTFVPPPLPAFLTTPCRPGFQTPARHQSTTTSCTQLPPRPKFRRFAWSKIPASRVLGRNNVWTTSDRLCREFKLDFDRIEELFSVAVSCATPSPSSLSPSSSTGVKYPASVSANGPQEMSNRTSSSTSKQLAHLTEVSASDSVYYPRSHMLCVYGVNVSIIRQPAVQFWLNILSSVFTELSFLFHC